MQNKNYCQWENDEVKTLFDFVATCRRKNLPLTYAFNEYAKLTNRKPNSVRNYYYLELGELQDNKKRRDYLNISLKDHQKQEFKEFTKKQEYDLAYFILQKQREGKSVRNSCLVLSNNSVSDMIRYQNKYRSMLKNDPKLIEKINKKLDAIMPKKQTSLNNAKVLAFPKNNPKPSENKNKLTDDELKGLFMGLVKLVKKSANLELSTTLKKECNFANESLRKALVDMRKKEQKISELTNVNKDLSVKVKQLQDKLMKLRSTQVKNINKS
jgi:hypothetical protein